MLRLTNVACRRDKTLLFSGADEFFTRSQKTGVTGANGCGKSSLFGMILGHIDTDEGEIEIQADSVIAHVAQETPRTEKSALDYVIDGDTRLRALERQLEKAQAEAEQSDGMLQANLLADFEAQGGYTAKARAGSLLYGLGFGGDEHHQPLQSFSGGWVMRLNLAQALMCPSDILLLDEPTNHLDLDAVLWLESWLKRYQGMLLLISHDREFLDRTVNSIVHIEQGSLTRYTGNYSEFETRRAERLAGQQALYTRQQREVQQIQRFVDRFRAKATKARQAQSRVKMLERMTLIAPAHVDSQFSFSFAAPDHQPDPLVVLDKIDAGYAGHTVLKQCNFTLRVGDRIALLGMNGAGKSTLIKTLVGDLPVLAGQRTGSNTLKIGYFAQHQVDQLDYSHTALDHLLQHDSSVGEAAARSILGGFGFGGDAALQKVETMSGGEKARLALALIVHSRPNLLLLDEPTNHLDLEMRHALGVALQSFEGALIVVSHDRYVLQSVADELWLVADGRVKPFEEDLDGYARWLSAQRQGTVSEDNTTTAGQLSAQTLESTDGGSERSLSAVERKEQKRLQAEQRKQLQPLRRKITELERKLDTIKAELAGVEEKLGDNQLYTNEGKSELESLLLQQADLKKSESATEDAWFTASEQLQDAGG